MSIKEVRSAIVDRLRRGEPTADLESQLVQERAKIAVADEVAELRKVADKKKEYERRAIALQQRIREHEIHLGAFLAVRDELLPILREAMTKARPLLEAEKAIFNGEGFSNISEFMGVAGNIPAGFLELDTQCSFLERSASGQEAVAHLNAALGILSGMRKTSVGIPPLRSVDEGL